MRDRKNGETDASAVNGRVVRFRRLDVVDRMFRVHLRGTDPSDLQPTVDEELEPQLADELRAVLASHEFSKRPVASGLFGKSFAWRAVPIGANHFAVLIERSNVTRRIRRLALKYGLTSDQQELLRLTAGGYEPAQIAKRAGSTEHAVAGARAQLIAQLECSSLRDVAELVDRRGDDAKLSDGGLTEFASAMQSLSSF